MSGEPILKLVAGGPDAAPGQEPSARELSDDALMKLTAARAPAAFRELVRRYQGRVLGVCVRSAPSADEGREIAQEVFVALWQVAPRYVPSGSFPSFLFTIVRNQLRSAARSRSRARAVVRQLAEPVAVPTSESLDRLLAAEDERRLGAALAALPEVHRHALLLRFSGGLPYEEIASLCDAPVGTVRSWVHHGIKKLRRLVGDPS